MTVPLGQGVLAMASPIRAPQLRGRVMKLLFVLFPEEPVEFFTHHGSMKILLILCLWTSTAYGGTTSRWWYTYTYPKGHCPPVIVVPHNYYYRRPKPRKPITYFTPRLQAVKRSMGAVPMPSYSEPLEIRNPYVNQ
jgi:hypothetical protein